MPIPKVRNVDHGTHVCAHQICIYQVLRTHSQHPNDPLVGWMISLLNLEASKGQHVEICYLWVDLPCRSTPPINCTQWNLGIFWVQNSTQPSGWDHFPPKSHENVWFWCHIPVLVVAMVKNQKLIVLYYRGDNVTSVNTVNHIGGTNLPNSDVTECHWMVFLPLVIFFCSALNQTDPKW